jgi:cAMP phosphodiesterase
MDKKYLFKHPSADYSPVQIGDSEMLPFGFPVIADAKGKSYLVELELLNPKSNNAIHLKTEPVVMSAISQMDKKYLFKHPTELLSHISRRVMNAAFHPDSQKTTILALPAFAFMGFIAL